MIRVIAMHHNGTEEASSLPGLPLSTAEHVWKPKVSYMPYVSIAECLFKKWNHKQARHHILAGELMALIIYAQLTARQVQ